MACMEHHCLGCGEMFMDNRVLTACPYCKTEGQVTNWFDEPESESGDDYEDILDD